MRSSMPYNYLNCDRCNGGFDIDALTIYQLHSTEFKLKNGRRYTFKTYSDHGDKVLCRDCYQLYLKFMRGEDL